MKQDPNGYRPRPFSRRMLMGGAGLTLALPLLESLEPRSARAQTATGPRRLLYYWVPNGIYMDRFRPASTGSDYVMPPTLVPLEALRADFAVVTGLENIPGVPDGPGDHAAGTASFITCAHASKSETAVMLGTSADQVAAAKLGMQTRLPSLQLGMDGGSAAGNCDNGYSCAYTRNVSWSSPTTPLPKLTDPKTIFNQLFQGVSATATQTEIAKRNAYKKSELDLVVGDANSLKVKLGRTDQHKLDEYLTSVAEIERQIGLGPATQCSPGTAPASTSDFRTKLTSMHDLMVLAMQCDATRIISFMLGNGTSGQTYPFLTSNGAAITRGHHDISHHGNQQVNLDMLAEINLFTMQQLGYLLTKMKSVTEGASNMLENSALFLSSDVSDGNKHTHDDMPVLLAGHGGGVLATGKHVSYAKTQHQTVANLLVTMLKSVGVTDPVGNSTGTLPELLA